MHTGTCANNGCKFMHCPQCESLHVSQNYNKFGISFASTFCFDCDKAYPGIVLIKPMTSGKIDAHKLFVETTRYDGLPICSSDKDWGRNEIDDVWDTHINRDSFTDEDQYWTDFWTTVETLVHVSH